MGKSTVYGGYWFWRPNERGRVSSTLLDEDIIARSNRKTSLVPHSYRFPLCVNIRKSLSERCLKTRRELPRGRVQSERTRPSRACSLLAACCVETLSIAQCRHIY